MKNHSKNVWKGKPNYVFKIYLLETDSYHDGMMGFTSLLILYITCIGFLIYAVEVISSINLSYWTYGLILLIGMVIPDIFAWKILKRKYYVLTKTQLEIYSDKNVLENKIYLPEIINSYSLSETNKIETIIITYQSQNSNKILTQKIKNILKADNFQKTLSKLDHEK